jgi:hypothetical protein
MTRESRGSARSLAEMIAESGFLPEGVRPADLTILNEALTSLFASLRVASKLYRDDPDHGRRGTAVTLTAVTEFLLRFRRTVSDELHLPLINLASALAALELNNVQPILRPVPRTGRAPDSAARQVMVGSAAGAVRQLEFYRNKCSRSTEGGGRYACQTGYQADAGQRAN